MTYRHRILLFDIENAPMLSYIWQLRTDYVSPTFVTKRSFLLSWAAKWADQKTVKSDVLDTHEAKRQDDRRIVKSLGDLVRQADIVVAHNSDRFDVPVLAGRLLQLDEEPLGPVRTIDTLKLAKRTFKLASNRLDFIARAVGVETKIDTSFDLWERCYRGESNALKQMRRYNKQDVVVLEQVFDRLKPHAKGLPRLVDGGYEGERVCPYCGEESLQKRGYHRTNASTFQRWHCQECGRWSRSRSAEKTSKLAHVPVS